jgi:purine-nucleoside phosphorylase
MKAGFGERVVRAAEALPREYRPRTAIVLGSGLSGIVEDLGSGWKEIPFSAIPELPKPTVQGHKGLLYLSDKAAIMAGRFHYYEGHPMDDVVLPIFALHEIGVTTIVLTNAAGAVNLSYKPGDLVLIKDHINLLGTNPFIGPNPARPDGSPFGERFFDMGDVYTASLRETTKALAKEKLGRDLAEGVYAAFTGPSFETPAEVRMARTLGADLVGMSTVPEAIAARHLGMRVIGISCVTNMGAGITGAALSHIEVNEVGKRVEGDLKKLVQELIETL